MAGMSGDDADFAVLGGGLVGAATAWGLARLGRRVVVLDEGDVAHRASRGNFALVWVQSKGLGMPRYAAWTRQSSDLWSGLADELKRETGIDTRFERPGGFSLALDEAELERRVAMLRRLHNQPEMTVALGTEIVDRGRLAGMLPEIGPDVVGGVEPFRGGRCCGERIVVGRRRTRDRRPSDRGNRPRSGRCATA